MTASRCPILSPIDRSPCELWRGHRGDHWNLARGWWARTAHDRPPPAHPVHGTIEDVRALQDAVRVLAIGLVLDGVRLP